MNRAWRSDRYVRLISLMVTIYTRVIAIWFLVLTRKDWAQKGMGPIHHSAACLHASMSMGVAWVQPPYVFLFYTAIFLCWNLPIWTTVVQKVESRASPVWLKTPVCQCKGVSVKAEAFGLFVYPNSFTHFLIHAAIPIVTSTVQHQLFTCLHSTDPKCTWQTDRRTDILFFENPQFVSAKGTSKKAEALELLNFSSI